MSRTPRRATRLGRHGPPSARTPRQAAGLDPGAGLRALVEEGVIAAAALNARDDLELAAASTQRLGALSSGMWRALSRELATAADRLDRSTIERLDDIRRRAQRLDVDADEVLAVGVAAAHLAEHRERLETLVLPDQPAHRLLGPNLLFAFTVEEAEPADLNGDDEPGDAEDDDEDDGDYDADEDDEPHLHAVEVGLFFWAMPLSPVMVSIVPALLPGAVVDALEPTDLSLGLSLTGPPFLLDALVNATGLSSDDATQALTALAVQCWTAHTLDELPPDDDDEEEEDAAADDGDEDRGPAGLDDV